MHASKMLEHSRNALLEHSTASKELGSAVRGFRISRDPRTAVLEHSRNALKCTCKILEYSRNACKSV